MIVDDNNSEVDESNDDDGVFNNGDDVSIVDRYKYLYTYISYLVIMARYNQGPSYRLKNRSHNPIYI